MRLSNDLPTVWWKKLILYVLHLLAFLVLMVVFMWLSSTILQPVIIGIDSFWGDLFIPWFVVLGGALLSVFIFDRLGVGARLLQLSFVSERFQAGSWTGLWVGAGLMGLSFVILWLGGWVSVIGIDWQPGLLLSWLLFFLVQPLAEEVVMRSFLQSQTQYYWGPQVGLIFTALIFGLLHADNDNFSWVAGLQITLAGYLMGLLYLQTQSIWGPYLMHASWNFLQSSVLGFAVSGIDTYSMLQLDINGPEWLTGGDFGVEGSVVSLLLLVLAIAYFWPARTAGLPLAPAPLPTTDETLLDESDTV